ncbi:MAG: anaerobic ribonucleoside-triphosphate reductase [bacterium]
MEGEQIKLERQPCEVYSRVVGYIRPVDQWNPGKQSEYDDRQVFAPLGME